MKILIINIQQKFLIDNTTATLHVENAAQALDGGNLKNALQIIGF